MKRRRRVRRCVITFTAGGVSTSGSIALLITNGWGGLSAQSENATRISTTGGWCRCCRNLILTRWHTQDCITLSWSCGSQKSTFTAAFTSVMGYSILRNVLRSRLVLFARPMCVSSVRGLWLKSTITCTTVMMTFHRSKSRIPLKVVQAVWNSPKETLKVPNSDATTAMNYSASNVASLIRQSSTNWPWKHISAGF